ncbi:uncharacterized protein [Epargyreus clarus]|uniref:uncharacterized protein n=1 Tax=Epargyreus clarus TaxID=520877 RepID=UPI003C2B4726
MAKFIKSIFNTTERRKNSRYEEPEEDKDFTPPLDGRRKLSISRSGRMRQANRKRNSLSLELYGENLQSVEKKNVEYHVNAPTNQTTFTESKKTEAVRRSSADQTSPEEEIDLAFEIIDKT